MNEFETFGFNIKEEGGKATLDILDNILNRLEKIQKLQNGGIGVKTQAKSTTNTSQVVNQSTRKATENSEELMGNLVEALDVMKGMTKETLSMQSAILSLNNAFIKLKDVEFKQDAIINNPNATQNEIAEAIDKKTIANNNLQKALLNVAGAYTKLQVAEENASKTPLDKSIEKAKQKQVELNNAQTKTLYLIEESNKAKEKQIRQDARVALGLEEVNKKQKKTNQGLLGYGIRLTTIIALARKFARFTSEAIKESASYIENLNLFAVTFGDTYKENAQWALDLANNLGLASSEAIRFTGLFKQLSTAIGNTAETGDQMSKVLTQFGYDLASFYNIDVTSAMEKLQAGIYSGQTKPLRSIGIDVTYQSIDNLLETNAALAQFNTSSKQLDQSQKSIARLIIALQSGSNAFGDMQATIGSLANQLRVLEGSLTNFKLAIGDLVNKPLAEALVYVNGFVQGITQVVRAFKQLDTGDKDNMISNLGADAEETNEALDETQKRLAGFDKFNVLQTKTSTTDANITAALTAELEKQIALYEEQQRATGEAAQKMAEFAKQVRDFFVVVDENGDFAEWTTNAKLLALALFSVAGAITYISVTSLVSKLSTLTGSFNLLNGVIVAGVIYSLIRMVEAFKEGDEASGLLFGTIAGIGVASFVALNYEMLKTVGIKIVKFFKDLGNTLLKDLIPNLTTSHTLMQNVINATILLAGALILFEGIKSFANVWDDMSGWERATNIIVALTAAIAGFVVATKALHLGVAGAIGVGAALAGGVLLIGSQIKQNQIKGYADGGFSNANLIMTHENGIREWVGRQGTSSAIVNDSQMSDIMQMAVARGVYEANMASGENQSSGQVIHNHIYLDGKQIYEGVTDTAQKYGKKWANA